MRIARVLTRLNLGGPARQVLASDPVLCDRGHEVRVWVGRPESGEGDLFEVARDRGIDVHRIPALVRGPNPWRDLKARRALGAELAEFQPDLVHTHASKAGALGRAAAWARTDAALVHTFHGHVLEGYFSPMISRRLIAHERRQAKRCTRVIAVSEATAADLARLGVCDRTRLRVVPPGIDLGGLLNLPPVGEPRSVEGAELRASIGCAEDDVLIGLVGRLAPVKRPDLALRAFAALVEAGASRVRLVLVGDGQLRAALDRERERLQPELRGRIHLLGAVEQMTAVHAALDLVLCCSSSEGLPVALIESAAAARPALACAVGGVGELVSDGETGVTVPAEVTAEQLGAALGALVHNPAARRRMGLAARERARARHSATALADGLERVYNEVIEAGRVREGAA